MSLLSQASLVLTPNAIKESKLYSIIPSNGNGDMVVTRATTATRVNSEGFIESAPYNLNTYSQSIITTNGYFIDSLSNLIGNANISPNGTVTASRFEAKTEGTTDQFFYKTITGIISGVNYTYSVYLKLNTGGNGRIRLALFSVNTIFNLTNGTIVSGVGTISNIGNGWYRCSISTVSSSISTNIIVANVGTFLAGQGHLVWGAQLVQGSVPKDYFPTTDRLNVPRLNYDVAGGCPSILLEPQRTNLATYSNDFSDAIWQKARITASLESLANPANTTDTYKLNQSSGQTTGGNIFFVNSGLAVVGSTYTMSVFAKKGEKEYLKMASSNGNITWFNLTNGTVGTVGVGISANIVSYNNGWYRCSITFTVKTGANTNCPFGLSDSNGSLVVVDSGGLYVYGAQLEQGAYPTSYIPTVATTVTRNADVISRNNIYTNGLITSAGGTWFVELNNNFSLIRDIGSRGISISDNITDFNGNAFYIRSSSATYRLTITKYIGGVPSVFYLTTTDTVKIAIKWNGATADIFVNGVKVVSATAFTTTNMELLNGGGQDVPKYIKSQLLFPTPLSDAECIQLTTL